MALYNKEHAVVSFPLTMTKNTGKDNCSTKQLILEDGRLSNIPFKGIYKAEAEVVRFSGLEKFCDYIGTHIKKDIDDTVFVSGIPKHTSSDGKHKVRSKAFAKKGNIKGSISLSDQDFHYLPLPTLMLIDYDPPKSACNAKFHEEIVSKGLINIFHAIVPELMLNTVDRVEKKSSSAGVFTVNAQGKMEPIKPFDGEHIYIIVSDGTKIQDLVKYIEMKCILSGYFWVEPNAAGRGMIKTPIDTAPSRPSSIRIFAPARLTNKARGEK